jgi:hypothetical protein
VDITHQNEWFTDKTFKSVMSNSAFRTFDIISVRLYFLFDVISHSAVSTFDLLSYRRYLFPIRCYVLATFCPVRRFCLIQRFVR